MNHRKFKVRIYNDLFKIELAARKTLYTHARKKGKILDMFQRFAVYGIPLIMIMFIAPYTIIGKSSNHIYAPYTIIVMSSNHIWYMYHTSLLLGQAITYMHHTSLLLGQPITYMLNTPLVVSCFKFKPCCKLLSECNECQDHP